MRRACVLLIVTAVTVWSTRAHADGIELPGATAAAVGRAGVAVVSSDDVGALIVNPAGLARRLSVRAQAGLTLVSRSASFVTDATFAGGALDATDRGPVAFAPWGGAQVGIGQRVTVGAGFLAPTAIASEWASPVVPVFDHYPTQPDAHLYPHRYAGLRLVLSRQAIAAGVAVRALPWLALGVSGIAWRTRIEHERMLWAGLPGPAAGVGSLSPAFDTLFGASADGWSPGAALGFVIAPLDAPVELAASVTWSAGVTLDGAPDLTDTRGFQDEPDRTIRHAVATIDPGATASIHVPMQLTFRTGARLATSRAVIEVGAEAWRVGSDPLVWRLEGVTLTPAGGAARPVTEVAVGTSFQDGYALRAAADYDVVPGAVAITAGYAWTSRMVPRTRSTPMLTGAASHTVAIGVQGRVSGGLVTLGVAHTMFGETDVSSGETGVNVPTPLQPSQIGAAGGRTDGATTTISVGIELAFD